MSKDLNDSELFSEYEFQKIAAAFSLQNDFCFLQPNLHMLHLERNINMLSLYSLPKLNLSPRTSVCLHLPYGTLKDSLKD